MRVLIGLLLLICLSGAASQQIVQPDANNIFHVTAGTNTATPPNPNGYTINTIVNGTLNMTVGKTYQISIEFANSIHPFGLNTNPDSTTVVDMGLVAQGNNTVCGGTATTGFTATATNPATTPCILTFTPQANTPQPLFYHCAVHGSMKGQILTGATAGGSTGGGSTGGSTTAPPTNGTTGAPTNPPKGGASGVAPGLGVVGVVFAAIAAAITH